MAPSLRSEQPLPSLRPALLQLHDDHRRYTSFEAFQEQLPELLQLAGQVAGATTCIGLLGLLEPLTQRQLEPRDINLTGTNLREGLEAGGCLSRHRGLTRVLELLGESLGSLQRKAVYMPETGTGFAAWLQRLIPRSLTLSDFLQDAELCPHGDGEHQDLCALTYASDSFDLVICNEVFEHIYDLPRALEEIHRVLRPKGRLIATFPMAFGQRESIIKASYISAGEPVLFRGEPEYHGDPIRPTKGSLVYQIPGWDILDLAATVGFSAVALHLVSSWKHGVLGADLAGVLVAEFQH
ncbi:MAG: class I SAM-dependent methyltransferase [Synechococcaceae bacterium WB9_2_112]|nr:class I SAM-dependent methyltransferase [Synechococcaceae bacterium WB9_2_112]